MPTETGNGERKYPSRTRRPPQPPSTSSTTTTSLPKSARTQKNTPQPSRIPALTTSRTFGSKSPLTSSNIDFQSFLAKCMDPTHWETAYTDEERKEIIQSLPLSRQTQFHVETRHQEQSINTETGKISKIGTTPIDPKKTSTQQPPLTTLFCLQDTYLKRAIARFKRDLADGYYEKSWQEKAGKAHDERLRGEFDGFLAESTKEMFVEEDGEGGEDGGGERQSVVGDDDGDEEYVEGARKARKGS